MANHNTFVYEFLNWILDIFDYNTVVAFKEIMSGVAGIVLGFLLSLLLSAFVLKDTTWLPDPLAERITVTKIKPGKRYRIVIIVPEEKHLKLSVPTVLVVFAQAVLVRLFPIKYMYFIDRKYIRIGIIVFLTILIVICLFELILDFHIILPDNNGEYDIINILHANKTTPH